MNRPFLVIGYGSLLRSDDGVGPAVADRLAADPRLDGVDVRSCHQLTPEMALDFSRAGRVVLIDASHGPAAGSFTVDTVAHADPDSTPMTHHISPSTIAALADELYGASPELTIVHVGVSSFEVGDRLTPAVAAAVPRITDAIVDLLRTARTVHA